MAFTAGTPSFDLLEKDRSSGDETAFVVESCLVGTTWTGHRRIEEYTDVREEFPHRSYTAIVARIMRKDRRKDNACMVRKGKGYNLREGAWVFSGGPDGEKGDLDTVARQNFADAAPANPMEESRLAILERRIQWLRRSLVGLSNVLSLSASPSGGGFLFPRARQQSDSVHGSHQQQCAPQSNLCGCICPDDAHCTLLQFQVPWYARSRRPAVFNMLILSALLSYGSIRRFQIFSWC